MYKLVFIFLLISNYGHSQIILDFKNSLVVDDVVYSKTTGQKFTGILYKTNENGQYPFQANVINGLYEGKYVKFYPNGDTLIKGQYLHGKLNGIVYHYNGNDVPDVGSKIHCWKKLSYLNGVESGPYETYYGNGSIFVKGYKIDGLGEGSYEIRWENNKLLTKGELVNNLALGRWELFNQEGEKFAEVIFGNGKIIECQGDCKDIWNGQFHYDLTGVIFSKKN